MFTSDVFVLQDWNNVFQIIITGNWRKMSGKRLRHSAVLIFTSKYASVKMTGLFDKKTKGSASRLTVDYSLPVLKRDSKNRIAFSTKFTERSTKTLFKQKYNVYVERVNPFLFFENNGHYVYKFNNIFRFIHICKRMGYASHFVGTVLIFKCLRNIY